MFSGDDLVTFGPAGEFGISGNTSFLSEFSFNNPPTPLRQSSPIQNYSSSNLEFSTADSTSSDGELFYTAFTSLESDTERWTPTRFDTSLHLFADILSKEAEITRSRSSSTIHNLTGSSDSTSQHCYSLRARKSMAMHDCGDVVQTSRTKKPMKKLGKKPGKKLGKKKMDRKHAQRGVRGERAGRVGRGRRGRPNGRGKNGGRDGCAGKLALVEQERAGKINKSQRGKKTTKGIDNGRDKN